VTRDGTSGGRRYGGLDSTERKLQRRTALLEAATTLFADRGYRHTSVRQICDTAQLTQRYFYESFADREAALLTVYDELVEQLQTRTRSAIEETTEADPDTLMHQGLSAFVDFLTSDTRRAQIILIEVVGISVRLETRRHAVMHEFAELLLRVWLAHSEPTSQHRLTAVALVGGVNHLLVDWLHNGQCQQPSELVRAARNMFAGARHQLTHST